MHCGIGSWGGAPGAAGVRVWHLMSRGRGPWTEQPLPEVVRVAYPLQVLQRDNDGQPLIYGGSGHIMGATRMGTTAKNSVVNKDCRSWDHDLFILGSSVFPTSSTANPTSTVAALSIRTVRAILRQLTERGRT